MKKTPRLFTNLATIIFICMVTLLSYVWINYDDLVAEQSYRQMWYLNHKYEKK